MPLSEDEKRILTEIEQQLYASDPDLARQVGSTTVYSQGFRRLRWGVLGLIAGLALVIVLLPVGYWLSFLFGFVPMLVATWHLERTLRHMGRAGVSDMTRHLHVNGIRDYFNNAGERYKERFKREEQ